MKLFFAAALSICALQSSAQYDFWTPKEAFAIEVSLENASPMKRLPINRNAITALAVSGDLILGGTSADKGLAPFVFTASLVKRELTDFKDMEEVVPGQARIRSGFSKGNNNTFYAGTIPGDLSKGGGHLIAVKLSARGEIEIRDLGVPIPNEGVFSLTIDAKKNTLYGISYPTGIFFSYNIATKTTRSFRDIVPTRKDLHTLDEFVLGPDNYLSKALVESNQGLIFGSFPINKLFCFDPKTQSFQILSDSIPEVWGRKSLGQVESWAKARDGKLYGGNAGDGQVFELNPITKKVKNLGKPAMMPHIKGLAFARDGKLYGVSGGVPGYTHLFSYDNNKGFVDYGNPEFDMVAPGIEQGIKWRGFRIATLTASEDGKYVVMGEDESLSQLLVFVAEGK
ncbi:MAG TPA: hypothetical protein PK339_05050 [Flavitalea sp.]|nr:hypothetical protein [Flavitalea sp.]